MSVTIMAAVARNGVIGRRGDLPWRLPDDLRRFRRITMGHVLVMGRRTYESIGRPLPGRITIVVTRTSPWPGAGPLPESLHVATNVPVALELAAGLGSETFVQGGTAVYAAALDVADKMLITWVDQEPDGDTWFPQVDWSRWVETAREPFAGGAWSTYLPAGAEKSGVDL